MERAGSIDFCGRQLLKWVHVVKKIGNRKTHFLTFVGTQNEGVGSFIKDWSTNLDASSVTNTKDAAEVMNGGRSVFWRSRDQSFEGFEYHHGFAMRILNDRRLCKKIREILAEMHENRSVFLTFSGHSLGGALAQIAMEWVQTGVFDQQGDTTILGQRSDVEEKLRPLSRDERAMLLHDIEVGHRSQRSSNAYTRRSADLSQLRKNFGPTTLLSAIGLLEGDARFNAVIEGAPPVYVLDDATDEEKKKKHFDDAWIVPENTRHFIVGPDLVPRLGTQGSKILEHVAKGKTAVETIVQVVRRFVVDKDVRCGLERVENICKSYGHCLGFTPSNADIIYTPVIDGKRMRKIFVRVDTGREPGRFQLFRDVVKLNHCLNDPSNAIYWHSNGYKGDFYSHMFGESGNFKGHM